MGGSARKREQRCDLPASCPRNTASETRNSPKAVDIRERVPPFLRPRRGLRAHPGKRARELHRRPGPCLLRAIVNLEPYTVADDLAEDIANDNEQRSAEEVLLAALDNTGDDMLTHIALRLARSGHVGVPRGD